MRDNGVITVGSTEKKRTPACSKKEKRKLILISNS
jgi:hypothetical protein